MSVNVNPPSVLQRKCPWSEHNIRTRGLILTSARAREVRFAIVLAIPRLLTSQIIRIFNGTDIF